MALTGMFALGPQLLCFSTDLEKKHVLEAKFHMLFFCLMIFFQNGGNIQDGVFLDFLCFSSSSGVLICVLLNLLFQNMVY
jgi:hypothetical protein